MANPYQTTDTPSPSRLVGQSGSFARQRFELSRPSMLVGRGGDCDLTVDDSQISRHHARLTWEAGHWFVEDLSSTNGTQVNGMAVTGRRTLLNPGGLLSLGGVTFKLETSGLEETIPGQHLRAQPVPPSIAAPIPPQPPVSLPISPQPPAAPDRGAPLWATLGSASMLILLGVILLAAAGIAAWLLLRPGINPAGVPQTSINFPANGAQVAEGDTLTIVSTATDRQSVSRLEIWIDGTLAQALPGTTPALTINYPWMAQSPGSHVIMARAYNAAGQNSDAVITVIVTASTSASPSPTPGQPVAPGATSEVTATPTLTPTSGAAETGTPTATSTSTLQPTYTPQPTYTSVPQPAPLGVFNDFETPTTWKRGDQPNGTFERSNAQAHSGSYAGQLAYNFPTGGNDFVVFLWSRALGGQPNQLNAWVKGDGSGHFFNVWIKDNGGQTWQFTFGQVNHTGWQQMTAYLDPGQPWPASHITGPDNGVLDYPISFGALVLDDAPDTYSGSGAIYVDGLESVQGSGPPLPTPSPTSPPAPPLPPPSGPATIDFRADRTTLNAGECTTLRWDVENVREVYVDGGGVAGHGTRQVCPPATTTYNLRVVLTDGSTTDRAVTITVIGGGGSPPPAPSNLTIAIAMSNGFGLTFTDNSGGTAEGFRLYNVDTVIVMQAYPAAAAPNLPISGLACGTTYRMALTAFNSSGESGPSNVVQGTTQSCP